MCGDFIRLEHMNSGRNLHSHAAFDSPVSGRQEVSGFGTSGDGDGGDNWIVECESDDVQGKVYGKTKFYLKHKDTGMYLYTDINSKFTN
jgi:dolichyl-phosphate-mannose--protein O-mannosyl transferase